MSRDGIRKRFSISSFPDAGARATDFFLAFSFLYITLRTFRDVTIGGNAWKQGDWLINNAGGEIRRGHLGSAILYISDVLGLNPLLTVVFVQLLLLFVLFVSFRTLAVATENRLLAGLLLISPAIFTAFWVADIQGAMRKELIAFAGLSICALATIRDTRPLFWCGVFLLSISFLAHEAMVFFVPTFLALLFVSGWFKSHPTTAISASAVVVVSAISAILFALNHPQSPDTNQICAPLLARGLEPAICGGAIEWLGYNSSYGFQAVLDGLNLQSVAEFLIAYGLALAPLVYLIRATDASKAGLILLCVAALPFLPLYVVAVDWGRWMSFHIFSATILLIGAIAHKVIRFERPITAGYALTFVALALVTAPKHTIGIQWGGVVRRCVDDILRILG